MTPVRYFHATSWLLPLFLVVACSGGPEPEEEDVTTSSGGASSGGAFTASGGGPAVGGSLGSGGSLTTGGAPSSGGIQTAAGGDVSTGGAMATGGVEQGTGGEVLATGGDEGSGGEPGGTGGTVEEPFRPCPESEPCKILPLGDSITVGWGSTDYGSYRVELFRLARNDGHDITYTGTKMDGPSQVDGVTFPRKHEGVAAETISAISSRVDGALSAETPHIVIVHAGTNDVNYSPAGAEGRLEDLVDQLIADLPDALIVVGNIIPFPQFADRVSTFNASVEPMILERQQQGAHVVFVDQFDGYPAGAELPDGVHPNDAGYARMAGKWYDAIEDYL